MANDLNHCEFIGRLGRDPETRYLADSSPVVNFSVAAGWQSKDKSGAEWIRAVAFGKLAEICAQYLKKGSQVYIAGRMQTRKWEKDGQQRETTEIVLERMQMLGAKAAAADSDAPAPKSEAKPEAAKKAPAGFDDFADDCPF